MDRTNDGGQWLDSNKGFSWTCVQTAGEEAEQLIKVSQSVYTASWMSGVRHVQLKFVHFTGKCKPSRLFMTIFMFRVRKSIKGNTFHLRIRK